MLHIGTPAELLLVVFVTILAAGLASLASSLAMGTDLMLGTLYSGAAILLLSIPVHLFFLARAPAEIDDQNSEKLAAIEDQLDSQNRNESIIDDLGGVLREARRLIHTYMGGDEEVEATSRARHLNDKIESIAARCDAKTRAIILADDRRSFDYRKWDNILFDEEEWPDLAQLALRIQAIERATGL